MKKNRISETGNILAEASTTYQVDEQSPKKNIHLTHQEWMAEVPIECIQKEIEIQISKIVNTEIKKMDIEAIVNKEIKKSCKTISKMTSLGETEEVRIISYADAKKMIADYLNMKFKAGETRIDDIEIAEYLDISIENVEKVLNEFMRKGFVKSK